MSSSTSSVIRDEPIWPDLRRDPVTAIEQPLVGAIFRLGSSALELAVLNRVTAGDFSESACGELFELARQQRLADAPMTIAALSPDIAAHGLEQSAGTALQAASTVTLAEVPILSQQLICESVYRESMIETGDFHAKLTATADASDNPRDLLRVFEQHEWKMAKQARRLKDML